MAWPQRRLAYARDILDQQMPFGQEREQPLSLSSAASL